MYLRRLTGVSGVSPASHPPEYNINAEDINNEGMREKYILGKIYRGFYFSTLTLRKEIYVLGKITPS